MPIRSEAQYLSGEYGGEGEQHFHGICRSLNNPERIYASQDVDGVWKSTDSGETWEHCDDSGLLVNYTYGVQVDPNNPDLVFTLACDPWNGSDSATNTTNTYNLQGLYRSLDGGENWSLVLQVDLDMGEFEERFTHYSIAYDLSSATDGESAKIWYVGVANSGVWKSSDMGGSWSSIVDLTGHNTVRGVSVNNSSEVYVYTDLGLYKIDQQNGTLSVFSDLPLDQNNYVSSIEIHPNDDNIIFVCLRSNDHSLGSSEGIYKTVNGINFSRLVQFDAVSITMNRGFPDVLYAPSLNINTSAMKISHDGGTTWQSSSTTSFTTGIGNDYKTRIIGQLTGIAPNPSDQNEAVIFSQAAFWKTVDGGANVYYNSTGFTGFAWTRNSAECEFHRSDPRKFAFFCNDVGAIKTDTGGDWFYRAMPDAWSWYTNNLTAGLGSSAGSFDPTNGSNRIIATIGQYERMQLMRSEDSGSTWQLINQYDRLNETEQWLDIQDPYYFVAFNHNSPSIVYAGPRISTDGGTSFSRCDFGNIASNGAFFIGMCESQPNVVYAMDNYRFRILRSNDSGATWSLYVYPGFQMKGFDRHLVFAVSPDDPDVIYTINSDGDLAIYDGVNWRFAGILEMTGAPYANMVRSVALDQTNPGVVYCSTYRSGTPNLFMSTDGAQTWEDISDGFPKVGAAILKTNPHTGELFLGSHIGTWTTLRAISKGIRFESYPSSTLSALL